MRAWVPGPNDERARFDPEAAVADLDETTTLSADLARSRIQSLLQAPVHVRHDRMGRTVRFGLVDGGDDRVDVVDGHVLERNIDVLEPGLEELLLGKALEFRKPC